MNFASARIITDHVDRLVEFYEKITGVSAQRPAPVFAEFVLPSCTLAIAHAQTAQLFGPGSVEAGSNRTVILEFRVDDIEAEFRRLQPWVDDWVLDPTTMPWGNRSMLFRDPDGNLLNFFEPVSKEAKRRFSSRENLGR
ncbi:VOC family protein [Paenibacillus spiritus]|uniref:VOC family protein n=1 Tax=Paenibacillus spiritus TaxID=2496557 RepID=A0A5J5G9I7_9BACL|nr:MULTISPECIES: VOC family protein [Paenibacillus]KAA9004123.1 VOC family protein [Paenibacillus spiritus]